MDTILNAVVMGGIGAAIGAAFAPGIADVLLKKMLDKLNDWYDRSMDAWEKWCAEHPGRKPKASAPGEEGALGVWADDCLRAMRLGELDDERTARAKSIGVDESCYIDQKAELRAQAVQNAKDFAGAAVKASFATIAPGFGKPRKTGEAELAREEEESGAAAQGEAAEEGRAGEETGGKAPGHGGASSAMARTSATGGQAADEGGNDER